jgi:hypothetical protein
MEPVITPFLRPRFKLKGATKLSLLILGLLSLGCNEKVRSKLSARLPKVDSTYCIGDYYCSGIKNCDTVRLMSNGYYYWQSGERISGWKRWGFHPDSSHPYVTLDAFEPLITQIKGYPGEKLDLDLDTSPSYFGDLHWMDSEEIYYHLIKVDKRKYEALISSR